MGVHFGVPQENILALCFVCMNDEDIRELRNDIKDIIGKLAQTNVLVHTLADAFRQEVAGSANYRRDMREGMGEVERRLSVVENHVRVVEAKLGEVTPAVEDYKRTRDEAAGAAKLAAKAANVGKALWAVVAALATGVATTVGWLGWLWSNRPPTK